MERLTIGAEGRGLPAGFPWKIMGRVGERAGRREQQGGASMEVAVFGHHGKEQSLLFCERWSLGEGEQRRRWGRRAPWLGRRASSFVQGIGPRDCTRR
jgi:hypothetical protein